MNDLIVLELKTAWSDGTRWVTLDAQTFLERLASLVPRSNTHQVVFRGVLAAHSARRALVVPEQEIDALPRPQNAKFRELMKHGLGLEVLDCSHCGARMQLVATIFDARSLGRLLRALRLPFETLPIKPARDLPQGDFDFGA